MCGLCDEQQRQADDDARTLDSPMTAELAKNLSDDLLLDNFHWTQASHKHYDLFRAELVRRLQANHSESRFNEIDQKLEQILGPVEPAE